MIPHVDRLLLSASFAAKCDLVFVLTEEKLLRRGFILKPTERPQIPLKNEPGILEITLNLRDWHALM